MSLKKDNYTIRLIDDKIDERLKIFGAICIEGPKWCGKTWTCLNHANSVIYLSNKNTRELAKSSPESVLNENKPELIDEWQLVPSLWDEVRMKCDEDKNSGKYLLTGSTTLLKENEDEVFHSGAGRIDTFKMYPMSLYESGDSTGEVSITDMFNNKSITSKLRNITLEEIALFIVRGGWPENIKSDSKLAPIIPSSYLTSVLKKDIHERKDKRRDEEKMNMVIKSLSRNISSVVSLKTIVKDIAEFSSEEERIKNVETISDYISVLDDLYLTSYQKAFNVNYRSSDRIGKTSKRHLVDPSLACAALNLTPDKLLKDMNTFGLVFESLVYRDLNIYMNYLDGNVFHFRDNISGDEVDSILEFPDGEYAAVEVKLGFDRVPEAIASLMKFYENVKVKPKFMCVITGNTKAAYIDKETGIYVVPLTTLKP